MTCLFPVVAYSIDIAINTTVKACEIRYEIFKLELHRLHWHSPASYDQQFVCKQIKSCKASFLPLNMRRSVEPIRYCANLLLQIEILFQLFATCGIDCKSITSAMIYKGKFPTRLKISNTRESLLIFASRENRWKLFHESFSIEARSVFENSLSKSRNEWKVLAFLIGKFICCPTLAVNGRACFFNSFLQLNYFAKLFNFSVPQDG